MHDEGWIWPEAKWLGIDLWAKTLGLVGVGRIGTKVARIAGRGFGMRVLGFDPYVTESHLAQAGVERRTDLRALAAGSDILSVHCVLNAETRGLIGERELA